MHEMVIAGDDEGPVREWTRRVAAAVEPPPAPADGAAAAAKPVARGVVVLGTHARIAALAPKQYRAYAQGPQGNAKILQWNAAAAQEVATAAAAGRPAAFVDPYRLTAGLVWSPHLFHFFHSLLLRCSSCCASS